MLVKQVAWLWLSVLISRIISVFTVVTLLTFWTSASLGTWEEFSYFFDYMLFICLLLQSLLIPSIPPFHCRHELLCPRPLPVIEKRMFFLNIQHSLNFSNIDLNISGLAFACYSMDNFLAYNKLWNDDESAMI